ncbi:hypothetical protein LNP27_05035 [Flavobacterium galactosidilyticum]|uniref:hypothetical protein n=1 Tax=Flavobacterium galactosidilyticum TaxID=2893886 RepID=UPI001E60369C|nr:hypothetical protein [Flavobacterium sp. F-340]UFH47404.1 hypothetical protein LNP27_05035 [Flavobacterium sp. F-340]
MVYKLFYIIYNAYYKHGEYKNDIPSLTVGGIFLGCFFGIGLSISTIIDLMDPVYDPVNKTLSKPSTLTSILAVIFYGSIVYFVFYYNKRYRKIYETYKGDVFLNSQFAKYIGFTAVIIIIVSPLIISLLYNKICRGYWV